MNHVDKSQAHKKPKLANVPVGHLGSVKIFHDETTFSASDSKELQFWANDPGEGPNADIFENVIYKSRVMLTFRRALEFMKVTGDETILELGSGQGWASAMLKRRYPGCYVVASDVSPHALQVAARYEALIGTIIDEKWACNASALPFSDNQFDIVFCFAAFHHFIIGGRYRATLAEMFRVLRPGGSIVLLFEPSSPYIFYMVAMYRANKARSHVAKIDEDVLQLRRISEEAKCLGATPEIEYFPDYQDRLGLVSTIYYFVLRKLPFLQRILPCTVNVRITKPT